MDGVRRRGKVDEKEKKKERHGGGREDRGQEEMS